MNKALIGVTICVSLMFCGGAVAESRSAVEKVVSKHMVAEAMLTAHYIDAALEAGMTTDEINTVLADIAERSVISEFWISDEQGQVRFGNISGMTFRFPTDPQGDTQAAPFAALLKGSETVVVQDMQEREYDGALFKYAGVAGVDKPRIVQVGISGEELSR